MKKYCFLSLIFALFAFVAEAQPTRQMNASEIKLALEKMLVVGNVLYLAAHPDDENTRMIAFLANEMKLRTAYLSLTRGDGGQNLIGAEVREKLGLIRTQELLAARKTDGGEQFFSSANDFGFSKVPDETFQFWNKEEVLSQIVWVIRRFKPDVILTRFNPNSAGKTHGHHTASALLAVEAFHAAADKNRFPEQLDKVSVWQAKRVLWNTSWFFYGTKDYDKSNLLGVEVGMFNPLLGKSYGEIAAQSRSMHKSQGFGSAENRGNETEYFEHLAGEKAEKKLFDGVEISWRRISGAEKILALTEKINADFQLNAPQKSLPDLLELRRELLKLPADTHTEQKLKDLEQIILSVSGLWLELTAKDFQYAVSDSIPLTASCIVRNPQVKAQIEKIAFSDGSQLAPNKILPENILEKFQQTVLAPAQSTQPYWLLKKSSEGMYEIDKSMTSLPENPPAVFADFQIRFDDGSLILYRVGASNKRTDPVEGEIYRPLEVSPPILFSADEKMLIFADNVGKKIALKVQFVKAKFNGKLSLKLPEGWRAVPEEIAFSANEKAEEKEVFFDIVPEKNAKSGTAEFFYTDENEQKKAGYFVETIDYKHIPQQTLFPKAEIVLKKIELTRRKNKLAYLAGAGDDIPKILSQIGYTVDMIGENDISKENLAKYDALIVGIRAFNTLKRLKFDNKIIFDYVENGGNVIVQYNTNHDLVTKEIAPLKLTLSRERVTEENAPVSVLLPDNPIVNFPNKISEKDFENWVQERGLYFPNEWDEKFEAILAANDKNEPQRKGMLLTLSHGNGKYIYSGISWFRQLPAGVEGAIRLFVNLIESKQ